MKTLASAASTRGMARSLATSAGQRAAWVGGGSEVSVRLPDGGPSRCHARSPKHSPPPFLHGRPEGQVESLSKVASQVSQSSKFHRAHFERISERVSSYVLEPD